MNLISMTQWLKQNETQCLLAWNIEGTEARRLDHARRLIQFNENQHLVSTEQPLVKPVVKRRKTVVNK